MPELDGNAAASGSSASAGGDQHPRALKGAPAGQIQFESTSRSPARVFDSAAAFETNAGPRCGILQAPDDLVGRVADRKHSPIAFRFERNAARLEPRDGIAGLETGERAKEFTAAARIMPSKFGGVEARMGDVAAAATGNPDLGQEVRSSFKE